MSKQNFMRLFPVMLCFFAMGFVDLVGIATNYVQRDLQLSDTEANLFPSLVFFWFLLFSVPTGILMNRIGRKRTVVLSLVVTFAALVLPLLGKGYGLMLAAFSLLGIGNTLMQTSLNPLVSNIVAPRLLTPILTFGQFVKAIASFVAPLLAAWGAMGGFPLLGLNWRILFLIYCLIAVLAVLALSATSIEEQPADTACSVTSTLSLLSKPFILLAFCGIMCHVGIDVGTNTTAPRLLMHYTGVSLATAGFATSVYFVCRTTGCLLGSVLMQRFSPRAILTVSCVLMLLALGGMMILRSEMSLYACIALIGLGNSNVFPIIFAAALQREQKQANAVSALMIMGLFGGTIFPLLMGCASDAIGQQGAVAVMTVAACYLIFFTAKMK
ncbi:MAG: MFS transporter [Alloprevotella sp.]